jgi:hypothetical protein
MLPKIKNPFNASGVFAHGEEVLVLPYQRLNRKHLIGRVYSIQRSRKERDAAALIALGALAKPIVFPTTAGESGAFLAIGAGLGKRSSTHDSDIVSRMKELQEFLFNNMKNPDKLVAPMSVKEAYTDEGAKCLIEESCKPESVKFLAELRGERSADYLDVRNGEDERLLARLKEKEPERFLKSLNRSKADRILGMLNGRGAKRFSDIFSTELRERVSNTLADKKPTHFYVSRKGIHFVVLPGKFRRQTLYHNIRGMHVPILPDVNE